MIRRGGNGKGLFLSVFSVSTARKVPNATPLFPATLVVDTGYFLTFVCYGPADTGHE
ncbi:MAG: hypothetical protein IT242_04365 [Bacteroidia bacterium]|nr:hypothetical protein [Bacteroidia bacterium]